MCTASSPCQRAQACSPTLSEWLHHHGSLRGGGGTIGHPGMRPVARADGACVRLAGWRDPWCWWLWARRESSDSSARLLAYKIKLTEGGRKLTLNFCMMLRAVAARASKRCCDVWPALMTVPRSERSLLMLFDHVCWHRLCPTDQDADIEAVRTGEVAAYCSDAPLLRVRKGAGAARHLLLPGRFWLDASGRLKCSWGPCWGWSGVWCRQQHRRPCMASSARGRPGQATATVALPAFERQWPAGAGSSNGALAWLALTTGCSHALQYITLQPPCDLAMAMEVFGPGGGKGGAACTACSAPGRRGGAGAPKQGSSCAGDLGGCQDTPRQRRSCVGGGRGVSVCCYSAGCQTPRHCLHGCLQARW